MADVVHGTSDDVRPAPDRASLDELNLEQALIDTELANSRVVDLTGRLTSMSAEMLRLRAEVGNLQLVLAQERAEVGSLHLALAQEHDERQSLRAELDDLNRSRAFRAARRVGHIKARLVR